MINLKKKLKAIAYCGFIILWLLPHLFKGNQYNGFIHTYV